MNEKLLRGLLKEEAARGLRWQKCPDEMGLAEFVEGHVEGKARAAWEAHLVGCRACRRQVAFLLRIETEPGEVPVALIRKAEQLAAQQPAEAPGWRWQWGAAALAAAVLLVAVLVRLPSPGPLPESPKSPLAPLMETPTPGPTSEPGPLTKLPQDIRKASTIAMTPQLLAPREGLRLSGDDVVLHWRSVPGSVFYEVKVATAEGSVVWSARTEGMEQRVPPSVFPIQGGKYFVWVRAYLPNGKTVTSDVIGFEVAAK